MQVGGRHEHPGGAVGRGDAAQRSFELFNATPFSRVMRRFNLFALLVFVGALGWVFTFDTPTTRGIQSKVMALFSRAGGCGMTSSWVTATAP